jgi:hypothetical protein
MISFLMRSTGGGWRGEHVADRSDTPTEVCALDYQGGPHFTANARGGRGGFIAAVHERYLGFEGSDCLDVDGASSCFLLRAGHRSTDDSLDSLPPFTRGHQLVGIRCEERTRCLGIPAVARIHVFLDKLPDGSLVRLAGHGLSVCCGPEYPGESNDGPYPMHVHSMLQVSAINSSTLVFQLTLEPISSRASRSAAKV